MKFGFTLIEILIVIGISAVLFSAGGIISFDAYQSTIFNFDFRLIVMITYDQDEKIISISRRHNLAFVLETIFLIIIAFLPYVAYRLQLTSWLINLFTGSQQETFFLSLALYTLWVLFLWILFFIAWSDHYLDTWIITDGRIIDVEQMGVFRRKINTFRLDKVTNLQILDKHWLGKVFDYGDIEVLLEGDSNKFIITEITSPERVREIILNEQKNALERLQKNQSSQSQADIQIP